jgi:hypothetical protein
MRILVGCEFSNTVSQAMRDRGHTVWSCDLDPSEGPPEWHVQGDIFDMFGRLWDLIILHPDCRRMAVSGNRWWAGTKEREQAIDWTEHLWNEARKYGDRVCMENPVSVLWGRIGKPQYIHPWEYGHKETKKTGLKLHNLDELVPTDIVGPPPTDPEERKSWERVWRMAPSETRGKDRSRFLTGWADAMAEQWG